jgi:hypothetical protein
MTREEFCARWNARLTECVRLGILVDGERFCREVLADFDAVISAENDRVLGLAERQDKRQARRVAGLLIGGECDPTYVHVLAEGGESTVKLIDKTGTERLIKP